MDIFFGLNFYYFSEVPILEVIETYEIDETATEATATAAGEIKVK